MECSSDPIVIVGGGAAGMTAAIFAKSCAPKARVILLDGARKLGAKILVSGGGRCNVTHHKVETSDFFPGDARSQRTFLRVLAGFSIEQTQAWFESLGVVLELEEETGKLFPKAQRAQAVLAALMDALRRLGVEIRTQHRVTRLGVCRSQGDFEVLGAFGALHTKHLLVAAGGSALPKSGSDGAVWPMLAKMGHRCIAAHPALVPLVLPEGGVHVALSGVALPARIQLWREGACVGQAAGSMLWTHQGISGPVVLNISRHGLSAEAQSTGGVRQDMTWRLSLWPEDTQTVAYQAHSQKPHSQKLQSKMLDALRRQQRQSGKLTVAEWLGRSFPRRLIPLFLAGDLWRKQPSSSAKADVWHDLSGLGHFPLAQLRADEMDAICTRFSFLDLPIVGHRGWRHAETSAGGVCLTEINTHTLASKVVPGLFLAGEVLNCDGRLGGFNFQWAWSTGALSGRGIAAEWLAAEE